MDMSGAATLITALIGALGFVGGALLAGWKWAVKTARDEVLREQVQKTLDAKDREIAELTAENAELRQWMNDLTAPTGGMKG